jgi:RNA polymerase sigma-70 factor (ECF subfamily)
MMQYDDTQLMSRILEGDVSGYAVLVDRYKDLAYTIAFRILGKREDAEEVVQDAFIKAFRNLPSFRQKSKFSTWLYRIVYNTAISKKRLKGLRFKSMEEMTFADNRAETENENEEDKARMLDLAMQQLPDDDRTIVTLYYLEESSVEEIHTVLGLSKANVKIKLFRARKKLQELVMKSSVAVFS